MQRFIVLLFCASAILAKPLWGCSCVTSNSNCGAMKPGDAVFVAKVLDIRTVNAALVEAPAFQYQHRLVRLEIVESFSLDRRVGDVVEVSTGTGGGDCGYPFKIGVRYLVDAFEANGKLSTGICSATTTEALASNTIRELRDVIAHRRLPDLTGSVIADDLGSDTHQVPVLNVPVVLTAQTDGAAYKAITDQSGVFTFSTLPVGTYDVALTLPQGQTTFEASYGKTLSTSIPDAHGAGAACHLDIWAIPSGAITGKIADSAGKGLQGFVRAYRANHTDPETDWFQSTATDEDGTFQLKNLSAGQYRIEFVKSSNATKWYVPGTNLASEATLIKVQNGQVTPSVTLIIP